MKYFNTFELIQEFITHKLDCEKHLKRITPDDVIANLRRKRATPPLNGEFFITDEPLEEENFAKLPQNIKDNLDEIHSAFNNENKTVNKKNLKILFELKKSYPCVPVIYNYIAVVYTHLGDKEKMYQTIMETRDKFPDYLFGKIALADYYIQNNLHDKIPGAFGNKLEIYLCNPKKSKLYHLSEVRAFYSIVGQYYVFKDKIDHALLCYLLLKQIDEEHPVTVLLGRRIVIHELEKIYEPKK